ncbi:MAG: hypothetical protein FK734_06710 [Asgard group archaeon]|nr:hypothetical protein [Asgard group archaeon]
MRGTKNKKLCLLILMVFVVSMVTTAPRGTKSVAPFFSLSALSRGGVILDMFNLAKQDLAKIGINIDIRVVDWPTFVGELIAYHDYDLVYMSLSGGGVDPDFTGVYNENGSLNLFGYDTSMDWDDELNTGLNEWYMKEGNLIMPPNSEERVQHYWEWEDYLMDKICPMLPAYTPKSYVANWAELEGYNFTDGILQSWGKMYWSDSHTGQTSTDELVITDAAWSELNPLFQGDTASRFITSLVMDPLIWFDADMTIWPHLAESFEYLDDTTIQITLREGIKWGTDIDGNFTNEYLDIDDVYFTLYCLKYLSDDTDQYEWIEEMEKINDLTLKIYVDGNTTTPEKEPYAPSLAALSTYILPEHYLNQTQLTNGITPDINHSSWTKFSTYCFGTGLFKISSFSEDVHTILEVRDDCWQSNDSITNDPNLYWSSRFGFGAAWDIAGMHQLRIRIIPDIQSALLEFEVGKVDIESVTAFPEKINEYTLNPGMDVQTDITFYLGFFGYNMREDRQNIGSREPSPYDETISKGLAIRKAISYTINVDQINAVIYGSRYARNHWPIYAKLGIWCNPDIIKYNCNYENAAYYMYLAGYNLPGYSPSADVSAGGYIITLASILFLGNIHYVMIRKRRE